MDDNSDEWLEVLTQGHTTRSLRRLQGVMRLLR